MPFSPKQFMQRKQRWTHVPPTTDKYQPGTLHSHSRDLGDTAIGEQLQEVWPDVSPDIKGLERDDTTPV